MIEIFALRLLLAVVLGFVLGFERFFVRKPAGIRTMSLVCAGSATFMMMAEQLQESTAFAIDPTRVAQGIITGVGFLGAGTILQRREGVRGLTTAATVWLTAAVGISAGSGAYSLALLGTGAGILILQGYGSLEHWMRRRGGRSRRSRVPETHDPEATE